MKTKLLTFLLAFWASIGVAFADASGTCGDNLTYSYDSSTGTLTITGSGAMKDWSYYTQVPWYSYRREIKTVNLPNEVTSIGDYAFEGCLSLTSVIIPNSVTSIGDRAFCGCSGFTSVTIPESVTSIGDFAFRYCSRLSSVTIPNSVTSIGNSAFTDCDGLTSVNITDIAVWCGISFGNAGSNPLSSAHNLYLNGTKVTDLIIPNSVTSIGNYAFWNCTSLTSVTIPNSVTSIGSEAFQGCTGLTSVTIGNSVTSIGSYAFSSCTGLTSVTIPNSVTSIGERAFQGCTGLTSVTIPNSVTSIGSSAFYNVTNIVYNGSATGSPWGARNVNGYVDGYLVYSDASKTQLLACSAAAIGLITIPESVTSIGNSAFYGCNNLQYIVYGGSAIGSPWGANCSVCAAKEGLLLFSDVEKTQLVKCLTEATGDITIPESVTSIGDNAFYECSGLTSVTIPNSVTSIGDNAFSGCTGLTSVTIGNSVTSIGNSAFSECSGLTSVTIGNSVTSIGNSAFYGCSGLTSVTIPNSVTSIGEGAFAGCSGLTSVVWNAKDCTDTPPFDNSTQITSFVFGSAVEHIPANLCYGMTGLTSIVVPESVTSIGNDAFYNVTNIVYNGSATGSPWGARSVNGYVDGYLVYSDASKTQLLACSAAATGLITIPESVTSIGDYAFRDCTGLTSVTIPNGVKSIGGSAFNGCDGLTSVVWNAKNCADFTSSSNSPFYSIRTQITSFEIGSVVEHIPGYLCYGMTGLTSVTIPNSVTSIGNYAFYGCTGLTSVTIPNSVTSIGYDAFAGCSGLTSVTIPNSVTSIGSYAFSSCTGLTSVTIGNSVTSIGNSAFSECSGLTSVTIGNSVTSIGNSAFTDCDGLTSVNITDIAAWCGISFGNAGSNPLSSAHNLYLNGTKVTDLIIPNGVTGIGNFAFWNCNSLTSVTIPNSVTSIGSSAFSGCTGLTNVKINDISVWCGISFSDDASNPLSSAHNLYLNGTKVTDLIIPDGVMSIRNYAFYDCTGLTSVVIGNSVTTIGNNAFSKCSGLTSVTIHNSVTSIGDWAFWSCSGLTSVIIPDGVTRIGNWAFNSCSGLTSVTIPNSVTSIGTYSFSGCSGLQNIFLQSAIPPYIRTKYESCGKEYFTSTTIPIYVPFQSVDEYLSSNCWGRYNIQSSLAVEKVLAPTSVVMTLDDMYSANDDVDIVSVGVDGGEMIEGNTMEYIGLEPESEYADVPIAILLSSGDVVKTSVSFTTTALTLNTLPSKAVSSNTAILLAETNMSDSEVSCGFEWKRNDAPDDMAGTMVYCPVANGMMAGRLKGLKDDVYYKYRAFYKSSADNMHYGSWQYIFTGDNAVEFDPVLYTYAASSVSESGATLRGYALAGSDDFTEQGFEYWIDSRVDNQQEAASAQMRAPVANAEHHRVQATGIAMKVGITGLDEGTVYKYRTYAKIGQQTVYGAEMSFTTKGVWIEPTALEGVVDADEASLKPRKVIENGRIVIIMPDGRKYDVTGRALGK